MPETSVALSARFRRALAGLSLNVVLVGIVSFLTDASSEMIVPLLPIFVGLTAIGHGVSAAWIVGIMEGIAEAVSALLKLLTGVWTDRNRRKKPFILAGYGISSVIRPLMGLASAWWHPVAVRVADRVGKGIRSSPRDVLIAESTPKEYRGKAFGFHRSMDHLGAVIGPLIAVWLIFTLYEGMAQAAQTHLLRTIFLIAAIPGAISLAVIIFWIRDIDAAKSGTPFRFAWSAFTPDYRYYLISLLLFTLGNSTDMFLVLRAVEIIKAEHTALATGAMALAMPAIFWAFFHAFKSLATAPLGALSDRVGRKNLIRLGWAIYALVYLGFAFMNRSWQAWPLFAVYALYYGLTEGVEKALVVDLAPPELKGTAVGMYNLTVGVAALPASVVFGLVYAKFGALAAFGYAGVLAMAAMVVLSVKVQEGVGPQGPRRLGRERATP